MSDVEVSYKGSTIGSLSASGTLTLETEGTWCEDDITVDYTSPGGGGNDNTITGTFVGDGTAYSPYFDYAGTPTLFAWAADIASFDADVTNTGVVVAFGMTGVGSIMQYEQNNANTNKTSGAKMDGGSNGFNSQTPYTPAVLFADGKIRLSTNGTPIARGCFCNGISYKYFITDKQLGGAV